MKKRVLCLFLAAVLTVLAGCGGGGGTQSSAVPSAEESAAESAGGPKKFNDVKLKMLHCWAGGLKTAKDQYDNEVAKQIREKTGVTVEFEGIQMKEVEKLNMMFASGDMPDIVDAPYWGGDGGETQVIKKAASEGRLLPIEKLIPQYPNLKNAYDIGLVNEAYLENDLDSPLFKGHRYILPIETHGDVEDMTNWAFGIFVRGDVPKALNIDPESVKTTEALYDFLVKARDHHFKDVNENDCIVATTYSNGSDYTQYIWNFLPKSFSPYVKNADGSYTYDALTDRWIDQNLFLWKMVHENILDKECFKCTDAQADEKVGNGTALFAAAQYGVVINSTKLTGLYTSHPEMRYVPVGPLNYSDGSPAKQLEPKGRVGSPAIFFPTTCSNIEAALTYLDYCNSEEGARLIQYGIEGETYDFNEKKQPRLKKEILERMKTGDTSVTDELREKGIGYIYNVTSLNRRRYAWWGETEAGQADTEDPNLTAYKKAKPIEFGVGYRLDKLVTQYKDYDTVKKFAFEGTTMEDYKRRAFFAETEAEAKSILKDYQNYLLTQSNGIFKDYLKFVTEQAKSRKDVLN